MLVVIQKKKNYVSVVFDWEDCCHSHFCFQEESKIYLDLPKKGEKVKQSCCTDSKTLQVP